MLLGSWELYTITDQSSVYIMFFVDGVGISKWYDINGNLDGATFFWDVSNNILTMRYLIGAQNHIVSPYTVSMDENGSALTFTYDDGRMATYHWQPGYVLQPDVHSTSPLVGEWTLTSDSPRSVDSIVFNSDGTGTAGGSDFEWEAFFDVIMIAHFGAWSDAYVIRFIDANTLTFWDADTAATSDGLSSPVSTYVRD